MYVGICFVTMTNFTCIYGVYLRNPRLERSINTSDAESDVLVVQPPTSFPVAGSTGPVLLVAPNAQRSSFFREADHRPQC